MKKTLLIAGLLFIGSILLTGCAGPNNSTSTTTTGSTGGSSSFSNGLTMPTGPLFADSEVPVNIDISSGTGPTLSAGDWMLYYTETRGTLNIKIYIEYTKAENTNNTSNLRGITTVTSTSQASLESYINNQNDTTWSAITQTGNIYSVNGTSYSSTAANSFGTVIIPPSGQGITITLKSNSANAGTKYKLSYSSTSQTITYYYQKR